LQIDSLLPSDEFFQGVVFYPFTFSALAGILIMTLLLIGSALISGAEVAFFSLSPKEKEELRKRKSKRASHVLRLLELPDKLLATILVANNFVNISVIILSAYTMRLLVDFSNSPIIGFIFQVVIITFLLLLFGEILPKVYASRFAHQFALFMANALFFLEQILSPVNKLLISSTSFVNKRLLHHKKKPSIVEISKALELTTHEELSEDKEILEGIVKFGNISVEEIMCSRMDVIALDIHSHFDKVIEVINESGYSRIPVYDTSFDNIRGILYIKDLLPHLDKGSSFRWQSRIRPPFYVPETKMIDDLLRDFQQNKVHMAIVVDEYGGSSGIITLEDVLEEIVGEINDELDEEEEFYKKIKENVFLFNGKTLIKDFCKVMDCSTDIFEDVRGDADSLAGLMLEIKGEIPKIHEKIKLDKFLFEVESADNRRIKQIKVTF